MLNLKTFQSFSSEEMAAREREAEQRARMVNLAKYMSESGIPKRHQLQTEPTGDGWLDLYRRMSEKLGTGVVLAIVGPRGTGKTQLGCHLSRKVAEAGRRPVYATALGFFLEVKESFSAKTSERAAIDQYVRPSLLIIDEVQERNQSDWGDTLLTHLVDRRYGDMKDTILLGNQTPAEFIKHVGPSITDRIREGGGIAEANWGSFRAQK
jgi:DNA replication protein DnaC